MELPPDLKPHLPGLMGSLTALLFIKDTWPRRIAMVFGGSALSFYAGAWAAQLTGMPETLAGYLIGLGGMAMVAKVFDTWQTLDLGAILSEWLRKLFRLEPRK